MTEYVIATPEDAPDRALDSPLLRLQYEYRDTYPPMLVRVLRTFETCYNVGRTARMAFYRSQLDLTSRHAGGAFSQGGRLWERCGMFIGLVLIGGRRPLQVAG